MPKIVPKIFHQAIDRLSLQNGTALQPEITKQDAKSFKKNHEKPGFQMENDPEITRNP